MPVRIDGTDITGATIDGTDVQEITVDGQTVFSAGPTLPFDSNLVSHYQFEGDFTDTAPAGSVSDDATNNGVTFNNTSKEGSQSADFKDNGDFLEIPVSTDNQFTGDFTIAFWFKLADTGGNRATALTKRPNTAGDNLADLTIGLGSISSDRIQMNDQAVSFGSGSFEGFGFDDNTFRHFAITADENNTVTVYMNGSSFGSQSVASINFDSNSYLVGVKRTDSPEFFDGLIDDLRFYDIALSSSQVFDLYDLFD